MRGQYKIMLVVQELEEDAIDGLTQYLFKIIGQIGAKPLVATHEIMNYSAQSDNVSCEICSGIVNVNKFETEIEMGDSIIIPFRSHICTNCYNIYDTSNAFSQMIGELVSMRIDKWKGKDLDKE